MWSVARQTNDKRFLQRRGARSLAAAQALQQSRWKWLARYATIARDFTAARQAALWRQPTRLSLTLVQPGIGNASFQTPNPELQNPENFYTCRYDFVPQAALGPLLQGGTAREYYESSGALGKGRPG
jgi:hypothetical protein